MDKKKKLFINKNAGNVQVGQAFFNANSNCTMMEETTLERYSYYGPVFRFDRYYGEIQKQKHFIQKLKPESKQ